MEEGVEVAKGDRFPAKIRMLDEGQAVKPTVRLTDNGAQNRHMPFDVPAFVAGGAKLLYVSNLDGSQNFYLMDLSTYESVQLTAAKGIFAPGAWYSDATGRLWYWQGTKVMSVDVHALDEKVLHDFDFQGGNLTVSSDGRYVAFAARCKDVPEFGKECDGLYVVMVGATNGDGWHPAQVVPFEIGRVQFSPSDPERILFTWQGPSQAVQQRTWWCDVRGLDGGPLGHQKPNETCDEAHFSPGGSLVSYHGMRYRIVRDDEYMVRVMAYVAGYVREDSGEDVQFECAGPTGTTDVSDDGTLFVCSRGGGTDRKGYCISLIRPARSNGIFDPLFYHGSASRNNWVSPRFRPGSSQVVFTADPGDGSNIYLTNYA